MSTHVKRVVSNRFILAISLVLTMIAFSLVLAQPPKAGASTKASAGATACIPTEYTYYTDSTYTQVCGWKIIGCGACPSGSSGCRTPYYTVEELGC